jgi:hypothetical protein
VRNRWTVEKDPVIGWLARLPEHLVPEMLRFGEETAVYRAGTSRIAYADPDGAVVEDDVSDLGAVLAAGPHAGPAEHREPLWVFSTPVPRDDLISVLVSSGSDIWLPWCSARYEEGAHVDDLADNRELARRHTPRLNEFLERAAELAERAGGTLAAFPDYTSPDLAFQLHDTGVLLDAANPLERSVWERFGRGSGDQEPVQVLRAAAAQVRREPPPPPYRAAIGAWTDDPDHALYGAGRAETLHALRAASRPLESAELAGVARVKVQTGRQRHVFDPAEVT